MRLGLGSAAAPGAGLEELLKAAGRRGLAVIELQEGHGHGLDPDQPSDPVVPQAAARAAAAGVGIAGFSLSNARTEPGRETAPEAVRTLAAFATCLGAPLLVPMGGPDPERAEPALRLLRQLDEAGRSAVAVLPPHATLESLDRLDRSGPGRPIAWEADPAAADLADTGTELLRRARGRLRHIRLRGGGPEATEQEGRGIGSLMTRLAVTGYDGTVALVPSTRRYQVIWDAWLGRRGGWGCGSRSEDRTLVSLGGVV